MVDGVARDLGGTQRSGVGRQGRGAPVVGWYLHHDGSDRLDRARAVAESLSVPVEVATAHPGADELRGVAGVAVMPDDRPPGRARDATANGALRWAPMCPDVLRPRLHHLLAWLGSVDPAVVVVDGSVEVALAVRLSGTPVVRVRGNGSRLDTADATVDQLSEALLAPFPRLFEHESTPDVVRSRTQYCGLIGCPSPELAHRIGPVHERRQAMVLWDAATTPPSGPTLDRAALATPAWDWTFVGPETPVRQPTVCHHRPWDGDIGTLVAGADVVVAPPTDRCLGLAGRTSTPLVALPAQEQGGGQRTTTGALVARGLALACIGWPSPDEWRSLLERSQDLDQRGWCVLEMDGAAGRAARAIEAVVAERSTEVVPA